MQPLNAQLPPPPEENSQFEVLLRPGLLADVEIIVEKIPNAIHIPTQAVFEKDGKMVAYVKNGNRFEERAFTPVKRSESTIVIDKGLQRRDHIVKIDAEVELGFVDTCDRGNNGPVEARGRALTVLHCEAPCDRYPGRIRRGDWP